MDIVERCAYHLNQGLANLVMYIPRDLTKQYAQGEIIVCAKTTIFNVCTTALIACTAFGVCGVISPPKAIIEGACFYFGRRVVDKSFEPKLANLLPQFIKDFKKPSSFSVEKIVIFYKYPFMK